LAVFLAEDMQRLQVAEKVIASPMRIAYFQSAIDDIQRAGTC